MISPDYSIQDLCDLTGLPRRTIHFYLQQRLLPPPDGAGLGARYDDRHLLRLRLIPLLRRRGKRLDDIRSKLENLDIPTLLNLFNQENTPPPPTPAILPVSRAYAHYELPAGISLVAPSNLSPSEREKLAEILRTAYRLFTETLPSND